jgi:GT2 family glycosyltransferase
MSSVEMSILIVSYNTRELLLQCIGSVIGTSLDFTYEIIVSENGSQDGSESAVRDTFPQVRVIQNGADLGFGAAVNVAARAAVGEYVAIVAPDAVMLPRTLSRLLDVARLTADARVLGCRLVDGVGRLQLSCARLPTPLRVFALFSRLDKLLPFPPFQMYYERVGYWGRRPWDHDARRDVETLLGAFLFMPASAFHLVGGFDERFFMYYEEVDLLHRLRDKGCVVTFIPDVAMVHFSGQATKQEYPRMRFEAQKSLLIYTAKWHGFWLAQAVRSMLIVLAVLRLLRFGLSRSASSDVRAAARAILRGLLRVEISP